MLERVQLVQRVPVMLFDADSAATIKDCVDTDLLRCNDTDNRLSLHHVGLIPFRRWWRCAGGGAAGGGAGEPCEGRYPPLDGICRDDKGGWFAEIFFRV